MAATSRQFDFKAGNVVASLQIDVSAAEAYAQALTAAPEWTREALTRFLTQARLLLEAATKDNMPAFSGNLRGSVDSALRGEAVGELEGVVFSPLVYAAPVELGTKPHWVPLEPLIDWVQARLGAPAKKAVQVAIWVRDKIAIKGTEGQLPFTRALQDNESALERMLDAEVAELIDRLNGAAPAAPA